jgi:serine phosphatase RsbU (regulator of sigma subunit)/PAS domain-containing protein
MVKKLPAVACPTYDAKKPLSLAQMANLLTERHLRDSANAWFAGSLAAALLLTAVDLALGNKLVLLPLLALPPLGAAVGSGRLRTAIVGAVCVVLTIAMGAPDDMFATREHLVDIVTVAAIAVAAYWIARVRERLHAAEKRSKLVADAGAALQRSLDPEATLSELARLAVPQVADWCVVHVQQEDGTLRPVAIATHDPEQEVELRELLHRYPARADRETGFPNVIRTGRPQMHERVTREELQDVAHDEEHLRKLEALGFRASLILPLTTRGRTLGAITFSMSQSGRAFGPEERRLADTLAARAAIALDNMQLYARASDVEAELRRSRDQLAAILDGVADGVTAQDPQGKMVYANEAALELLGFPSVKAIHAVPIRYVLSRFELFGEDGEPFPLDRLPGRQALMGKDPEDALVRFRRRDTGEQRWSVLKATPIRDPNGRLVLAINIFEDVTEHIERERSQRVLARVGEVLTTSLSYERTLQSVADLCVPEVADLVAVDLLEEGQIRRVAVAADDGVDVRELMQLRRRYPLDPDAGTGVPAVIRSGAAELHPELSPSEFARTAASPNHAELIERMGLRSAMFVPMSARGRTFGAITLCAGERTFDESDLYLAEELAARCAIAVDNARLFRERTRIARTLQESLLPPLLPELPGVDVGARFHAAGQGYEVGGDFYDVFEIGGGSFGVAIGDVCGKGPDAAAVTALARYTLRATALTEPSPARVLKTLNDAMLKQPGERRFCTVAYVRFDPIPTGMVATIASGGHPLPLALRAGTDASEVGLPGSLLGVLDDPEIDDVRLDLFPGDSLVLFTDGVTEARAPKRVWGANDLARFVGAHEPLRAAAIAERIERGALSAQAEEPRDDVAIVVLKVVAGGAPTPVTPRSEGVPAL